MHFSKSNSAMKMHQRANCNHFGEMEVNDFRFLWSVVILTLIPKTYWDTAQEPKFTADV